MIKLSKRLEEISKLIDKEDNVLDIGCDHALLDIYLSEKYDKEYYASDLKEIRLKNARENIKKYQVNNVKLLEGNGLEVLDKCNGVNTLVISGMGYMTINNMLKNIKKLNSIKKLVIQSNSDSNKVRKFVLKNDFYIDKEVVVFDKNFYYIISVFKRGKRKYSKLDKEVGIMNLYTDKELYKKYLETEIKKYNILLNIIPKKEIIRRINIKKNIKYLVYKKNSIID